MHQWVGCVVQVKTGQLQTRTRSELKLTQTGNDQSHFSGNFEVKDAAQEGPSHVRARPRSFSRTMTPRPRPATSGARTRAAL